MDKKEKQKLYREKHKERYKLLRRLSYLKNKEEENKNSSKRYYLNKETINFRSKLWRKNNKEIVKNYNKNYSSKRKEDDINFLIRCSLRTRISVIIRKDRKGGSAVKDLGCSIEHLKKHLESQFTEGMSWDNYGLKGWHIDHIIPLAYFDLTKEEDFKNACHYTNLQPLWAVDNIRKGVKIMVQ